MTYLGQHKVISQQLGVTLLDSRFRGNDRIGQVPVIPAKAGIQKSDVESSHPGLLRRYNKRLAAHKVYSSSLNSLSDLFLFS